MLSGTGLVRLGRAIRPLDTNADPLIVGFVTPAPHGMGCERQARILGSKQLDYAKSQQGDLAVDGVGCGIAHYGLLLDDDSEILNPFELRLGVIDQGSQARAGICAGDTGTYSSCAGAGGSSLWRLRSFAHDF